MHSCKAIFAAGLLTGFTVFQGSLAADTAGNCRVGAYRLDDGSLVDIGASTGNMLRWRRFDGTTGALHPGRGDVWTSTTGWSDVPDGKAVSFAPCSKGELVFAGEHGRRVALEVTDTTFHNGNIALAGRLVMPKGTARVPVVVLIHGSETYSGRDVYPLQRILPAEGVGVFVYDKRGTGHSSGAYTQDFDVLANDAVAAADEARRLAGARAGRVGFEGGSQGGYVAPLAATRTNVDFVIAAFGLAISPLEEDREEVVLEMQAKHHTPKEIAEALEVADAAGVVLDSNLAKGFEQFDAVRAKYRNAPWYKDLHGNFTYTMLPYDRAQLLAHSKEFLVGAPMHYDPMPVLEKLTTPQLWILGGRDFDAPSAETARRLKSLQASGRPITLAIFPDTQHGIYEFVTTPDGERVNIRNANGYFAMIRDYATGGMHGGYGNSDVSPSR